MVEVINVEDFECLGTLEFCGIYPELLETFRRWFPKGVRVDDVPALNRVGFELGLPVRELVEERKLTATLYDMCDCADDFDDIEGTEIFQLKFVLGKLQDGKTGDPAIVCWFEDGTLLYEGRYCRGKLNDRGVFPAQREWNSHGKLIRQSHFRNGKLCDNGVLPANRQWWGNGQLKAEDHYNKWGVLDDVGFLPAQRSWSEEGDLLDSRHFRNGVALEAREDSPVLTVRYRVRE